MMLKFNRSKQSGISLLEVLLSLSVIAVILVMATRYYAAAQQSQQASNALSMINGIVAAETQYKTSNTNNPGTLAELTSGGYLPANFGTDPWGGALSITTTANNGIYTISSNAVIPKNTCTMLNGMLLATAYAGGCSGSTLSVQYQ